MESIHRLFHRRQDDRRLRTLLHRPVCVCVLCVCCVCCVCVVCVCCVCVCVCVCMCMWVCVCVHLILSKLHIYNSCMDDMKVNKLPQTDRQIHRQTDRQTDRRIDGWTDRQTDLSILCESKHGLLSPHNLHWVQFTEVLTQTWRLGLAPLHTSKLTTMVVSPPIDSEEIA